MHVCFVTTAFPRWPEDGQGAFVYGAARALVRAGVSVHVVAMHSPGCQTHDVMEGVEVTRPRYWWPESAEALRRGGAGGLPTTWREYPAVRFQIAPFGMAHTLATTRVARSCDIVHAQWTLSAACALAGRAYHRRPIIVTVQGSDIFQVPRHPLGARLTRRVLTGCRHVTALSGALARAVQQLGVAPSQISIVPNGVDTTRFVPPEDGRRDDTVLYVGSLIERKGLRHLLAALPETMARHPALRLAIIGEGPEEPRLRTLAHSLGITDSVDFMGTQTQAAVRDQMQRARVLVLPSTEEGLGVVLLEALACGTPVVASDVGGIPDVVTPDVGRLVPPASPTHIAGALAELLEDAQAWERASRQARRRAVEHYDWVRVAARFLTIYEEVLEGAAPS